MSALIAWDTETHLTTPGKQAPPLVCHSFAASRHQGFVFNPKAGNVFWEQACAAGAILIAHNSAFDLAVMAADNPDRLPEIFDMLEAGRFRDTMIREKLLDIARGRYRGFKSDSGYWVNLKYNLAALTSRRLGIKLEKEDNWRLHYNKLDGIPIEKWAAVTVNVVGSKGQPLQLHGADAYTYAAGDATSTFGVYEEQEIIAAELHAQGITNPLADEQRQIRKLFWLHLCAAWGLRTDAEGIARLEVATRREIHELRELLRDPNDEHGIAQRNATRLARGEKPIAVPEEWRSIEPLVRPDHTLKSGPRKGWVEPGSKDTKAAKRRMIDVCLDGGLEIRITKGEEEKRAGKVKPSKAANPRAPSTKAPEFYRGICLEGIALDKDACDATGDPILQSYCELTSQSTVFGKDIDGEHGLKTGLYHPIHTFFESLLETGRTSSSRPNVQNVKSKVSGLRECFIPRAGFCYLQSDFKSLELHTLAEALLHHVGWSRLAEALNAGLDAHTELAARLLGISQEDAIRRSKLSKDEDFDFYNARQTAKVANFGFAGGLGAQTMVLYARKLYKLTITLDEAKDLKRQWLAQWPEMVEYFRIMSVVAENGGTIQQLYSGRWRGRCNYTQLCNTLFQGLGADATGEAGWAIARACYIDSASPLFGCRMVNFIHDEFILEAPFADRARLHAAGIELVRLMVEAAGKWTARCPVRASKAVAMDRWSKDAESVYDANGHLDIWRMKAAA